MNVNTSGFTHGTVHVGEWVLAIAGAIAALVGLLSFFASDDVYVGLGGEASWPVADIPTVWGYTLFLGGVAAVLLAGALARWDRRHPVPAKPRTARADLLAHTTAFVLVNALVWAQDIALGGGLEYAYWVTIPWGIGLLAHAIATAVDERQQKVG